MAGWGRTRYRDRTIAPRIEWIDNLAADRTRATEAPPAEVPELGSSDLPGLRALRDDVPQLLQRDGSAAGLRDGVTVRPTLRADGPSVPDAGRGSWVTIQAVNAVHASVVGGRTCGESVLAGSPPPEVAPAEACPDTPLPVEFVPFCQHLQFRFATEARPFGNGPEAELVAWVRPVLDVPLDAAGLVLLTDAMPPALYAVASTPVTVPTVDLTVSLTDAPTMSGWVLLW